MRTRVLYLDDSGKPDAKHASRAVVIAGFAVDADLYPTLSRRVQGAKGLFYPKRGAPKTWEIKSETVIKPNPWKRSNNRKFAEELGRIIKSVGGTIYSAAIDKTKLNHPMSLATTMPLQLQCLVEHFDAECRTLGTAGMVIADWSSQFNDQHASQCVASFVVSRKLCLHPCVYYASSHSCEAVQVADVIAGVRRRTIEGDMSLAALDGTYAGVRTPGTIQATVLGRAYRNVIQLI